MSLFSFSRASTRARFRLMSKREYVACHQAISDQHGNPPNSFLDELIDTISSLPDEVFEKNDRHDIYSVVAGSLGPFTGIQHRAAVMCEVLRVQAGFESDWNWNGGVDVTNAHSLAYLEGQETGAFQVSWDSMAFDGSLEQCVARRNGGFTAASYFIAAMKSNHPLAVEYCARLLRSNTRWCGTINDPKKVIAHVRRDAVEEFKKFIVAAVNARLQTVQVSMQAQAALQAPAAVRVADRLVSLARDPNTRASFQATAAKRLLAYDGEVYPRDGCAITMSVLLQAAGLTIPDTYQAFQLGQLLRDRGWKMVPFWEQQPGDLGSTCGLHPQHGVDHIYLVVEMENTDPATGEMLIADNQDPRLHTRRINDGKKASTKFFLRAP